MSKPLLEKQPNLDGELVFDAPWQARTFAMAVKLHEAGMFSWSEWSHRLAKNIANAEEVNSGAVENSDDYYTLWQQTLEMLIQEKESSGGSK